MNMVCDHQVDSKWHVVVILHLYVMYRASYVYTKCGSFPVQFAFL